MFLSKTSAVTALTFAASLPTALGQWVTENYDLQPGWNSIWMSHDSSHATIDELLASRPDILEVWRWNTIASNASFTGSPDEAVQADSQWLIWKRGLPFQTSMTSLAPNAAYLVRLDESASATTLSLTGKPTPPAYQWSATGASFLGFPTQTPADPTRANFQNYFRFGVDAVTTPQYFKYDGGDLTSNPRRITSLLFEPVTRGRAYWLQHLNFTDFYGPLRVSVGRAGIDFTEQGTAVSMTLKNVTDEELRATLAPRPSVSAPSGQRSVAGNVPLQIQGALDPATGLFALSDLGSSTEITLAAGEESEIILVVNRRAMGGSAGDVFQSILEVRDSLNQTRIDLPVRAVTTNTAGVWVGAALVNQVDQITAAPGPINPDGTSTINVSTEAVADTPEGFPLRLIFHRDDTGTIKFLQQVYLGANPNGDLIATTDEANLDPGKLAEARRISSSHFPLGTSQSLSAGDFGVSGSLSFSVALAADASTNPFLHTYHPDHDEASESQQVTRAISLQFTADPSSLGLSSAGFGSTVIGGSYSETLTGLRAQPINISGNFVLYRVSDISTLSE